MAIFQSDLIIHAAIRKGLIDLRQNTFVLEDAMSDLLTDPDLRQLYGQKELDNFIAFVNKKIEIFIESRTPDVARFPCFVIKVGGGTENTARELIGDGYQAEFVDGSTLNGAVVQSPQILLGPVTPISFDSLTGLITFAEPLGNIFTTHFVRDEVNKKNYPIEIILDEYRLIITLDPNDKPNLTNMTIRPQTNNLGHTRKSNFFYENHTISMLATSATEVIYLHNILYLILTRYKKPLFDAKNFQISTFNYSEIYRAVSEDDANNVYGRNFDIRALVENSVIESTNIPIGGLSLDLKIVDVKTDPANLPIVKNTLISGEND